MGGLLAALFLLYPFIVYLGLKKFQPEALAALLLAFTVVRLLINGWHDRMAMYAGFAALIVCVVTWVSGSQQALFFYPVLVNLSLLGLFAVSLIRPPTIIEMIARKMEKGEFPDRAVAYTRKVTVCWCIFFLCNGLVSLLTITLSPQWWMIYNGFIAYLLIALMMGGEYLVRRRVRAND